MIPWRKFRYLQIPNIWQFGSINHQCYSTRQGISRLVCHLSIATYSNQESASPWPQHSNHHQRHHACQQHPTMYLHPSHIDTVVGTIKTLSVSIGQFQFLPEKAWQTSTNWLRARNNLCSCLFNSFALTLCMLGMLSTGLTRRLWIEASSNLRCWKKFRQTTEVGQNADSCLHIWFVITSHSFSNPFAPLARWETMQAGKHPAQSIYWKAQSDKSKGELWRIW